VSPFCVPLPWNIPWMRKTFKRHKSSCLSYEELTWDLEIKIIIRVISKYFRESFQMLWVFEKEFGVLWIEGMTDPLAWKDYKIEFEIFIIIAFNSRLQLFYSLPGRNKVQNLKSSKIFCVPHRGLSLNHLLYNEQNGMKGSKFIATLVSVVGSSIAWFLKFTGKSFMASFMNVGNFRYSILLFRLIDDLDQKWLKACGGLIESLITVIINWNVPTRQALCMQHFSLSLIEDWS